jgi:DNA-binding response OmpR family regulator
MKPNRILIIDDDEEICEEIKEILTEEGYLVDSATNGIDGMNCIKKNKYNILLLDMKIPGLSGYEILKRVKNNYSALKVLIITGRPINTELLKHKNNLTGEDNHILILADAILSKPYDVKTLLDKIKEFTAPPG